MSLAELHGVVPAQAVACVLDRVKAAQRALSRLARATSDRQRTTLDVEERSGWWVGEQALKLRRRTARATHGHAGQRLDTRRTVRTPHAP